MTTYAKATNVRVPYLTEGREYEVLPDGNPGWFKSVDDNGKLRPMRWGWSSAADFQRIEKEEA